MKVVKRWKDGKVEGFSFVATVTGLNRSNTGKEDDDKSILKVYSLLCKFLY
jgi:hypothetical protein